MTLDEHETIVNLSRSDTTVSIYSSDPRYIRRIRKDDRFTVTREHVEDGDVVAIDATIPTSQFDPLTGLKARRRKMTDEERARAAERLKKARESISQVG